ncbi:hypothetical protein BV898_01153 [Hypsibius exemplaris]|uniref:Uncharacterized protein n=1 Tax=Hypsibius exemplaris TaxID=2072580 RepID=A0A1W0XBQ7_HYPEX|nr:hypothetical protein BV898_01153 [Hypsibius exemplaris]
MDPSLTSSDQVPMDIKPCTKLAVSIDEAFSDHGHLGECSSTPIKLEEFDEGDTIQLPESYCSFESISPTYSGSNTDDMTAMDFVLAGSCTADMDDNSSADDISIQLASSTQDEDKSSTSCEGCRCRSDILLSSFVKKSMKLERLKAKRNNQFLTEIKAISKRTSTTGLSNTSQQSIFTESVQYVKQPHMIKEPEFKTQIVIEKAGAFVNKLEIFPNSAHHTEFSFLTCDRRGAWEIHLNPPADPARKVTLHSEVLERLQWSAYLNLDLLCITVKFGQSCNQNVARGLSELISA